MNIIKKKKEENKQFSVNWPKRFGVGFPSYLSYKPSVSACLDFCPTCDCNFLIHNSTSSVLIAELRTSYLETPNYTRSLVFLSSLRRSAVPPAQLRLPVPAGGLGPTSSRKPSLRNSQRARNTIPGPNEPGRKN